ncbi:hypothetical protein VT52_012605 [Streptomyces malaysiense]|uniref:Uncharacterized protein n=1 Tax=Streptomyces malaysiense TaxID=1428626 RepID=A0A1J4Q574_9ACTN|nr:hypothetical protein VT52_012605 [Streptomyces malaysiense]
MPSGRFGCGWVYGRMSVRRRVGPVESRRQRRERAYQRPSWRATWTGRPKQSVMLSGVSTPSTGPDAGSRPSLRRKGVSGAGRELLHVVGDGDGGEAGPVGREPLQCVHEVLAGGQVEVVERLVEQEQRRIRISARQMRIRARRPHGLAR